MSDRLLAAMERFLDRSRGLPFCSVCLAHEFGIRDDDVRELIAQLDARRFAAAERLCVRCFRHRPVVCAVTAS